VVLADEQLQELADELVDVDGVTAVALGGSRARGDHAPDSDVDLGLYYEASIDLSALGRLARRVAGSEAEVTAHGAWGPWVDGGAWLRLGDVAVDWIYRDLARVRHAWDDAQAGRYAFHAQAGHPLGVPDFAYSGEVALSVVLADPTGRLGHLREEARHYPPALAAALVEGLWEADFCLANARKAVSRCDAAYVAGCLFRAVLLCAHALHGTAGRWLVNEKGAVTAAGQLACAPAGFAGRAHAILADVGGDPAGLHRTIAAAAELLDDVTAACASAVTAPR
jgi:hypothetical protein